MRYKSNELCPYKVLILVTLVPHVLTLDMVGNNQDLQDIFLDPSPIRGFPPHLAHHIHNMTTLTGISIEDGSLSDVPLFYDTFFPILYEVDVPFQNASDLRVHLPTNITNASYSCDNYTTSNDSWAQGLCPVIQQLNVVLKQFSDQMIVLETLNPSKHKMDSKMSSCHEIRPHFSNNFINHDEINMYALRTLTECPLGELMHIRLKQSTVNQNMYSDVLSAFIATHISPKYRMTGYTKYAISTNTLLAMHSLKLLDSVLEGFQWYDSINTCNSQRIPGAFVPYWKLQAQLKEIQEAAGSKGLSLTLPIDDISNYYKYPLADCVFTNNGTYIVRVLVPLRQASADYKLVKIKTIPVLGHDLLTKDALICQHRISEGAIVINNVTRLPITRVRCDGGELCRIPPAGERSLFSSCLVAFMLNNTKEVEKQCQMQCTPYPKSLLPFIKRVSPDQFAVAGSSSAEVAVLCASQVNPLHVLNFTEEMGSLIVTLPCDCYLSHRADKYYAESPCDLHLDIQPIRTFHRFQSTNLGRYLTSSKPKNTSANTNTTTSEQSKKYDAIIGEPSDDDDYRHEDEDGSSSGWPIYFAYVLILIGALGLIAGYLCIRNVYIRLGQLEVATARESLRMEQYHTNAVFKYTRRAGDDASPNEELTVH